MCRATPGFMLAVNASHSSNFGVWVEMLPSVSFGNSVSASFSFISSLTAVSDESSLANAFSSLVDDGASNSTED